MFPLTDGRDGRQVLQPSQEKTEGTLGKNLKKDR